MHKPDNQTINLITKALTTVKNDEARSYLRKALYAVQKSNEKNVQKHKHYEAMIEKGLRTRQEWLENIKKQQQLPETPETND